LDFNNPKLTTSAYKEFLDTSFEYLQYNATLANDYNTAQMLLLAFTWRSYYDIESLNSTAAAMLHIAADPWYTISRHPYNWFTVTNGLAYDSFRSGTDFFNGYMRFTTYDTTVVSDISNIMGTSQEFDQLQIGISIQSFFVAAAINRGILDFGVLQSSAGVPYSAIPSNFSPFSDPRYPTMNPIYCDESLGKCVLYVYPWGLDSSDVEGAYYPIFESYNTSDTGCTCPISYYSTDNNCFYNILHMGLGYLGRSSSDNFPFKSNFFTTYTGYDTTDQLYYCTLITQHVFKYVLRANVLSE
jgi:hypothetical protein